MIRKTKTLLNDKYWRRLQPFLRFRSARQRVILYLIIAGYTVGEIIKMTRKELFELNLHHEAEVWRDEMQMEDKEHVLAFVFPSGNALTHTYLYRLIRASALKAVGQTMSQEQLRKYVCRP